MLSFLIFAPLNAAAFPQGSPTKDTSYTDDSISKDKKKKKKKGLRTPSFLKMKKEKKKEKEAMHQ